VSEFLQLLKSRRSVRAFLPQDIPDNIVAQILTAGTWAPNAGNAQPWYFYVIREEYLRRKLVDAALGQGFLAQAPVVIVVCADLERARASYQKRGETLYCLQDTAAAVQNMLLCAHSMGLGACWVGAFDETTASKLLDLPAGHRPVAMIPVGRPARAMRDPGRRPLDEVYSEID
jgi:nitroreductase